MKALILAAGYATRLYPITLKTPKSLLKIGSRYVIDRIIDKILAVDDIKEIYIVTNSRFKGQFDNWLSGYKSPVKIKIIDDGTYSNDTRLGAIGDINFVLESEGIDEDLLVIAGDILFNLDLDSLVMLGKKKSSSVMCSRLLSPAKIANKYGNIVLDDDDSIIAFEEKPEKPLSSFAATPIYFLRKDSLQQIRHCLADNPGLDAPGNFIKYLINKEPVYSFVTDCEWHDIGDKDQLVKADIRFGGRGDLYV